jgi:hypothetical protein
VSEDFLHDSIKKGKAQDASHYLLDSGVEDSSRKRKTRGAKEDSDEEEEAPVRTVIGGRLRSLVLKGASLFFTERPS